MKLYYYFNNACRSCKNYASVVNEVVKEFSMEYESVNIEGKTNLRHQISGIPSVVIEDGASHVLLNSTGNLPLNNLKELIREKI